MKDSPKIADIRALWGSSQAGSFSVKAAIRDIHAVLEEMDSRGRTIEKYRKVVEETRRDLKEVVSGIVGMEGKVKEAVEPAFGFRPALGQRDYPLKGDIVWCPECLFQWPHGSGEVHHQDCTHVGGPGHQEVTKATMERVVVCPTCHGDGRIADDILCSTCEGEGVV